jgi:hypothetical protein
VPVHDWTSVDAGIFHAFHHDWITEIARSLNRGLLPPSYYALPEPDVLTLHGPTHGGMLPSEESPNHGVALAVAPPRVSIRMQSDANRYAAKAKAVAIRHVSSHSVVAMVEIVSPGNKSSQSGLNAFVRKADDALAVGIHLLIVDLFPPSARDPQGIHRAIWGDDCGADFALPDGKPLTCVAYIGGPGAEAFIEPVAVGDSLPEMPLFLTPDVYVLVPLEATYQRAWDGMAAYWRNVMTNVQGPRNGGPRNGA